VGVDNKNLIPPPLNPLPLREGRFFGDLANVSVRIQKIYAPSD